MFPTGGPGVALLLLRAALGTMLLHGVPDPTSMDRTWFILALWTVAIALCAGLLTPLTAALSAGIEITAAPFAAGGINAVHVCAVLVALALAMLGPGAYSLDAWLFGRRQIIFSTRDDTDDE